MVYCRMFSVVVGCFDVEDDRRNFLLAAAAMGLAESTEYVFLIGAVRSLGMLQQGNGNQRIENGLTFHFFYSCLLRRHHSVHKLLGGPEQNKRWDGCGRFEGSQTCYYCEGKRGN